MISNKNKIEKLQSKTRKIDKEFWQKLEKKTFYTTLLHM